jgi:hypothetical protein
MAKQVKQELVTKAEELHNELTVVLEALKTDFVKCSAGNLAAGTRSRKNLRLLRTKLTECIKFTNDVTVEYKADVE